MLKRVCQSSENLLALSENQTFVRHIKAKHKKIKIKHVCINVNEIKLTHQTK
jgi:hypothetical protein